MKRLLKKKYTSCFSELCKLTLLGLVLQSLYETHKNQFTVYKYLQLALNLLASYLYIEFKYVNYNYRRSALNIERTVILFYICESL